MLSESSTATVLGSSTKPGKDEGCRACKYGKHFHRKHVIVPTMHVAQMYNTGWQISDQTLKYDLHSLV